MLRSPLKPRMKPPFRIKDLVHLTGVSKEAIRFYSTEGLLPPPQKSARNMAWYDHRHVEVLQQIRRLQQEHFLSLKAIKTVLDGHGGGEFTEAQLESLRRIRQKLEAEQVGRTSSGQDAERMAGELGLSSAELRELRDLGVGMDGVVTGTDLEIARQWVTVRNATREGAKRVLMPRDGGFILDAVRLVLDHELELFTHRLRRLDADRLEQVIQQAVPALNRIFVLMHERAVNQFISDYLERNKKLPPSAARQRVAGASARDQGAKAGALKRTIRASGPPPTAGR